MARYLVVVFLIPAFLLEGTLSHCDSDNTSSGNSSGSPSTPPGTGNHPPSGNSPGGNSPGGNSPGGTPPNGNPPNGNPPSGNHPPSGNSPGGNSPGGNSPGGTPPNGNPPNGNPPSGPPGGNGGSGGKPEVVISFDSLNDPSIFFFKNQLKPIFDAMTPCVKWHFIPCSTSKIVNDVLHCKDGVMECQIDVLHACAAHFYENDEVTLGKFFICMMTHDNQYVKGEGCAKEAGMDWKLLCGCQPSKQAGEWCDNRYKQLDALHEPFIPGVIYNMKYDANAEQESLKCLKTGICNQIKKQGGSCPACGSNGGSGGGSGGSGGGTGGNGGGHGGNGGGSGGSGGSTGTGGPPSGGGQQQNGGGGGSGH